MSELNKDEEVSLGADFTSAEELDDAPKKPKEPKKGLKSVETSDEVDDEKPSMADPEWSDYVLRQFTDAELDGDGRPLVAGLRRVARLLLGPIIYSGPAPGLPFQAPSLLTGFEKLGVLQPAVVGYMVKILMCKDVPEQMGAYEATFADVADVYAGNTDPDFARHATATASTKAESRCLRKALQLRGIASEEKTLVPSIEAALDGMITPGQINFISVLCNRNNVNVTKFINAGKKKYESIYDVEAGVAAKMVEHLAGFENSGKVPEALRGYDPKWNS